MQFFAPEILMEGHGLAAGISGVGLATGLLLWITGWWGHRFWAVLAATLLAGVLGLVTSPWHGMKPLLAGILLAVAAGVLALALVRLVIFAATGTALYLVIHNLAPVAWDEPFGWFLLGGLAGLLMFRFFTMVLTSLSGTLLMGYSLLCLLDTLGKIDAVSICEQKVRLLNAVCLGVTAGGVVIQILLEKRRKKMEELQQEVDRQMREREEEVLYGRRRWFRWFQGTGYRKAS
jgi:hypothetical protein